MPDVSPFRLTRNKRYIFSPCATPTMSFDTPIQQIVTFLSKQLTFQNSTFPQALQIHHAFILAFQKFLSWLYELMPWCPSLSCRALVALTSQNLQLQQRQSSPSPFQRQESVVLSTCRPVLSLLPILKFFL